MFDIGLPEFAVLALIAIFVFGPDKLPEVAKQAAKVLRTARTTIAAAKAQVADELGPEYANLDLRDLNPRALVQKHLLGPISDLADEDEEGDEEMYQPVRAGQRPLESGEEPPYDYEAT
jgi:sec-independent protein translocase protein TatB